MQLWQTLVYGFFKITAKTVIQGSCGSPLRCLQKYKTKADFALCRSRVWIGMEVLRPDSIILGTRKLWWTFPIKQKFDTTLAFLDNPKCSIWSNLTIYLIVFSETSRCTMVKKSSPNFCLVLNIFTIKKAAVVSNFCLI